MRRTLHLFILAALLLAVSAPAALAEGHDGGEGWWGETSDKIVTNAGFIIIAAFPLLILLLSLLQHHLDKRKDNRRRAAKARVARADQRGGW
jgi:preprotein translocase subunit SecG